MGDFKWTGPSVEARMTSFDTSIEQMLWPEKRKYDTLLGTKVPGVDRPHDGAELLHPAAGQPAGLRGWTLRQLKGSWIDKDGMVRLGPIPAGTPVNLISNLELVPDGANFFERMWHLIKLAPSGLGLVGAFWSMPDNPTEAQQKEAFKGVLEPLLAFSKCPDFVVNRGHYFGTDRFGEEPGLNDQQKKDLIEFLKTL